MNLKSDNLLKQQKDKQGVRRKRRTLKE
jgi:hypothetical protein